MAGRKIRDTADARSCLAAVARSGLDRRSWGQAHGVDGRSLQAWVLNLGRRASDPPTSTALRLVELVPAGRTVATGYRVHVGSVVLEVDAGFDEASLRRLLAVLSSC